MAESKHDKFIRIAENRTNKIIEMVRLLGNCSNKITYEYTETEVKTIFNTIENELRMAKSKFQSTNDKDNKFRLR